MLEFIKQSADGGTITYVASDGGNTIGECRLTLEGTDVFMTVSATAYENFVLASSVNAAAAFGLRVTAPCDVRLEKYGFVREGDRMAARPAEIKFPSECGGN